VFVPRTSSTPVATWFWQTEGRSAERMILGVRPSEFISLEFQSPSRRIFYRLPFTPLPPPLCSPNRSFTCASGGNEDHMVGYFPLVMGKAPLLWLDNVPAECITSWATLSRLFTTNYQATYNRPGNTHHLARVRMRRDETLREYTNRYF
jgi:hypothetical protein